MHPTIGDKLLMWHKQSSATQKEQAKLEVRVKELEAKVETLRKELDRLLDLHGIEEE